MKDHLKTVHNKREQVPATDFILLKATVEAKQMTARISDNYP